ncbi:uncharacterized protein LOC131351826 [Hemibagrus wyckioides]|uniref:uncharacterized protein LOC131351826 n=1 Tax=Hemibagrus wyckioides TaxID=337641 RepID=UPI00266B911A|nr:uncharacterized protein LOC131351826 [Hemibagrus wyckioides]
MMVHAIKVQADVHRVPDFQVTAEELEGISLSQTEPDFTRGINPDEFYREPGNDSLVEDLDLILTGASPVRTSPAISRDRRVQHAPPRSGDPVIEILPTPTPRVASVMPILKACDTPRRAKGLKFVSKSPSIVKRLFTGMSFFILDILYIKPETFFNYLFSGKYVVEYFDILDDWRALIRWRYGERCVQSPGKRSNVFIVAFTTAYTRLKMYDYMERLRERVLYTDTDSLIYVVKEGEMPLELGNYLGELTDELDGDSIQELVSTGPKTLRLSKDKKKW